MATTSVRNLIYHSVAIPRSACIIGFIRLWWQAAVWFWVESAHILASNAEVSGLGSHVYCSCRSTATMQTSFIQQLSRLRSFTCTCENTNLNLEERHLSFTCHVIFKSPAVHWAQGVYHSCLVQSWVGFRAVLLMHFQVSKSMLMHFQVFKSMRNGLLTYPSSTAAVSLPASCWITWPHEQIQSLQEQL